MRKNIFWGLFLITIGILWLLKILSVITFSWFDFLHLWPLILVWIGVGLLPIHDGVKILLNVIALAVGIFILLTPSTCPLHKHYDSYHKTVEVVAHAGDDFASAKLELNAGAAVLKFVPGDNLVDVQGVDRNDLRINVNKDRADNSVEIDLNIFPIASHTKQEPFAVTMSTQPVWDIELNLGAAKNDIDLSPFKVEELEISCGASEVNLKIGELQPDVKIELNSGTSSFKIEIPKSMNCFIKNESALSSVNFEDFTKLTENSYQSLTSDSISKGSVNISIESGVSSFKVIRY